MDAQYFKRNTTSTPCLLRCIFVLPVKKSSLIKIPPYLHEEIHQVRSNNPLNL
jgi:hypothetical protein